MTAATFDDTADLVGRIRAGQYTVALSEVSATAVGTLGANARVTSMEVVGSGADVSVNFDDLIAMADAGRLASVTLDGPDAELELTAQQVRNGGGALARVDGVFRISATDVTLADLAEMQAVPEVTAIGIRDSAANVAERLDDLAGTGALLASIRFTDADPVLALTAQQRTAAASVLARIDGSWAMDLSEVNAADVQALDAEANVRTLSVGDTGSRIAENWSALVAAYNAGNGKLDAITVTDDGPIALTQAQQDDGAAMIAALLAGRVIVTVG
jgi:hypothetical protein